MIQLEKKRRPQYRNYLEQCKLEGAQLEVIFVHHMVIPNIKTFEANNRDPVRTTRAVQRHHMKTHTDILCHCYTYPDGWIVPARSPFSNNCGCQYPPSFVDYSEIPAGLRRVYEQNTHGWGWRAWMNAYGFSIETCGWFDIGHEDPTTSEAMQMTLDVAADVCEVWGLDPETRIFFHRDVTNWDEGEGKSCPGSAVDDEWVIEQVANRMGIEPQSKAASHVVLLPGHENNAVPLFHNGEHFLSVRQVDDMFDDVELIDRREEDGKLYFRRRTTTDTDAQEE